MDPEKQDAADGLEIEDLEFDVGGAGAVEAGDTQVNHGANLVIYYR